MTSERAPILVHGATGFTGNLVCASLVARGLPFAISGRNRDRLERLAERLGGAPESVVVDVSTGDGLRAAIEGRRIVLACAGPFVDVGEPVLATCARLGVHYVDTTGEQRFVADAVSRYQATCEASGACVVPSMAYEIAPADWVAHLAAEALGGAPDVIDIVYATQTGAGGYGGATTRGTKKSMLRMLGEREPLAFVDGALRVEAAAEIVRTFDLPVRSAEGAGNRVTGASFPSPESIVVPKHTGARTVRTFMAVGRDAASVLRRLRHLAPSLLRAARPLVDRIVDGGQEGPEGEARTAQFVVVAFATKGAARARVGLFGRDPYGLTAEIQAYAAARATTGEITARGVVGPSVAFPPREAIAALASFGLRLEPSVG